MKATSQHILHQIFGYSSFRGEQQAIVEHVAAGGDALVLMPTGSGFYNVKKTVSNPLVKYCYFQAIFVNQSKFDFSQLLVDKLSTYI